MSIKSNVLRVQENIESACLRAGRSASDVALMAVTKYVDTARIAEALACGVHTLGENHAQELREKLTFYKQNACSVHFIGQLQTNKIKYVCGSADCIQSVDRSSLVQALEARAERLDCVQKILIQVNIGAERQKGGVEPEALEAFLDSVAGFTHLSVCGLMCIPPGCADSEEARPYFRRMYSLFVRMKDAYGSMPLTTLSMGMSHDYPVAIEEGATMVRVGTALFGQRHYV